MAVGTSRCTGMQSGVCPSRRAGLCVCPGVQSCVSVRPRTAMQRGGPWACGCCWRGQPLPGGAGLCAGVAGARRGARVGVSPACGGAGSAPASRRLQGAGVGPGAGSVATATAVGGSDPGDAGGRGMGSLRGFRRKRANPAAAPLPSSGSCRAQTGNFMA